MSNDWVEAEERIAHELLHEMYAENKRLVAACSLVNYRCDRYEELVQELVEALEFYMALEYIEVEVDAATREKAEAALAKAKGETE